MRRIILVVFALFLTFSFTQETSAQLYRYTDKDGVMHFTDTPTDPEYFRNNPPPPQLPNISLDFNRIDIVTFFRLLSDQLGLNFVVSEEARHKIITVRLVNVPLDQAIKTILITNNLSIAQEGNIFIIGKKSSR